ncbi:hypothetical protein [Candidatus Palauibacter sp.]|uniref:hypothetical protein n=1 Tax=Candidatus Palauibacter sp. TaxID=3101350 RepID=UPI003B021D5D
MTGLRCRKRASLSVLAGLALMGCASGRGAGGAGASPEYGAPSAEAAVAQFLDGVRGRDYPAMARLFGTAEGPAERRWGRVETEQRMFVLAGLLAHRSRTLRAQPVGDAAGTSRWIVELTGTRHGGATVPFIAVSYRGRWFVERILTKALVGS